jgi:Zn-dependent protease with chaperone function
VDPQPAKRRARQWFWLIGVPVILLLAGLWQWSRTQPADTVNARLAQYQAMIHELDAIQARDGWKASVKDETGRTVTVSLMKSRVENAMRALEHSRGLADATSTLQRPLAAATITLSALALLWAGLGLAYQRRMAARAMRSREQLLAAFLRGKALLPTYMAVTVLLLFSAAITFMAYELVAVLRHQRHSDADMKLGIAVFIFAAMLLYYGVRVLIDMIRAARRPLIGEPVQVMGQIVTHAQAPRLWDFVGTVARRIGASAPEAIVVGLDEGFFVTEHPVRLRNGTQAPAGLVLYMPLPYMAFMNATEVAAVIGHELGHFMGEDTVYSRRFSPIYTMAMRHIEAIAGDEGQDESGWRSLVTRPATAFGEMFLDGFHEAVRFWSRKRELAADAVGARAAGARAVATSLLRIAALEPRVNEALAAHWDAGQTVSGGVLGQVRQLVAAKGMANPGEHLHNRQSHPFDTHPELAVRLEAVGMPVSDELLQRAMDPAPSQLLQELGLEAAAPAQASAAADETAGAAHAAADPPAEDINAALQTELSGAATTSRQAKIQELSAMVRAARASQPVCERVRLVLSVVGFLALCFVLAGVSAILARSIGINLTGLALLALGIAALAWCAWVFQRSRKPALVIRPEGLQLFDERAVLPWGAIHDFGFIRTNHTFVARLHLEPQAEPPALDVSRLRASYSETRRQVRISLLLGGKRADRVMHCIVNYWRAYSARVELQRMGVGAEPAADANPQEL